MLHSSDPLANEQVLCDNVVIWTISTHLFYFKSTCKILSLLLHIEAETKWLPFSRRQFSNVFSWMKTFELQLRFHWSLFPRAQLFPALPTRWQAIVWTNDGLVYWHIYASLGHNELNEDFQLLTLSQFWEKYCKFRNIFMFPKINLPRQGSMNRYYSESSLALNLVSAYHHYGPQVVSTNSYITQSHCHLYAGLSNRCNETSRGVSKYMLVSHGSVLNKIFIKSPRYVNNFLSYIIYYNFHNFLSYIIYYNFRLPRVKFNWSSPSFGHQGRLGDHKF